MRGLMHPWIYVYNRAALGRRQQRRGCLPAGGSRPSRPRRNITESIPTARTHVEKATPHGLELSCRGWEQEGALRCLLNNLDPAVAERSDDLVVYGGTGKAARNRECLEAIVAALRDLDGSETLIVQSGKPVAVLPTHPDAPRVLISSAMLVPAWSTPEDFWALEAAGLTMYGQMTAGGWFYIGTQGVLGFTYETFSVVARTHFGDTLTGKRVLTAGLGGMGGAQGLGVVLNGGRVLVIEVDPRRARRRAAAGWIDLVTDDYRHALNELDDPAGPAAIGLVGNAAELVPRLVRDGVGFDVVTDQTAAHDLLHGYVPVGYAAEDAERAEAGDARYLDAVRSSIARHVEGLLELRARGAIAFEYGNNIRAQARDAGVIEAMEIPGFVSAYVRPLLAQGIGPYRWIALSGDPEDLRKSEDALMEVVDRPTLRSWIELARTRLGHQGLPARICWLGLGQRDAVGLRLNELVRSGEIGPLALGRDHMDPAAVASPARETEGMQDGSDAIADWPILGALLNAAQGASWVAVGNGGGVGIGRSIHSGMVVVADGSELAERKIARVFWSDPALGVARYADAGYDAALAEAERSELNLPMRGGVG
jgi:urocanate hydratase